MIRINLLPPQHRKTELPLGRLFAIGGALVLLFCTIVYSYGYYERVALENEIEQSRVSYQLLSATAARKAEIDSKTQLADQKKNILAALTKQNTSWHAIMAHLGSMTTTNVWLTNVALDDKKKLDIHGTAANYQYLAAFLARFETDSLLTDAVLVSADYGAKEEPKDARAAKAKAAEPPAATTFQITAKFKEL